MTPGRVMASKSSKHHRTASSALGRRSIVLAAAAVGVLRFGGLPAANAEINHYNGMELPYPNLIYREAGMFSPGRFFLEPGADGGNGESFIRLVELQFDAEGTGWCSSPEIETCVPQIGYVDLAIFEQKSFGDVGVVVGDTRYYCCNMLAQSHGACSSEEDGNLLFSDESQVGWRRRLELSPGQSTSLEMDDVFHVLETGMYVVLMANCESRNDNIHINGHSEWMNPYGYLPGEVYGCLPFFFFLAVVYLVLGVVWMVMCMTYIKDLLAVQLWASIVLLLGMVETAGQYFDYRLWNMAGDRSQGIQCFAILFGAAKRALSFSLILMVCMGYGVVRPSLGRDVHRIMTLALSYFITSALWVALNDARGPDKEFTHRPAVGYSTMLVFFNALITVAFYGWTLQSIFGVIQHLRQRRQAIKLQLYQRFLMVLVASALFALLWSVYGITHSTERETIRHWQSNWTVNAIWEMLYLAILIAVCVLLRPSMNAQRFAFSEVPTNDGDKGEYGDILLQVMDAEDAEYGGPLEDDEGKGDEFVSHANGGSSVKKTKSDRQNVD